MLLVQAVQAQATYQYTGNNFTFFVSPYTSTDHMSITLRLPTALPPGLVNADFSQNNRVLPVDVGRARDEHLPWQFLPLPWQFLPT